MNQYQVTFFSTYEEADRQAIALTSHVKKYYDTRFTDETEFNLNFVLRELFNNAIEHGNALQAEKNVVCKVIYDDDVIAIEVTDEGQGLTHSRPSHEPRVDGAFISQRNRGLWLIEQLGYHLSVKDKTIIASYHWR